MEPFFTLNYPLAKLGLLSSDRNRFDLDWQGGGFTWRYPIVFSWNVPCAWAPTILRPTPAPSSTTKATIKNGATTAIYVGCIFPIGRHIEFNPYYEHQNSTGKSPNQQYNQLGLMLNLYFSRH